MNRLKFIYLAAPLTVALNTLPGMVEGVWRIVAAAVIALVLWAVVWIRIYHNGKLRPEYAVLAVVPAVCFHILQGAGPDYLATFSTPGWQNFNFFLWLASIFVIIRALQPTTEEYKGRMAADSVLIFMSIVTTAYSLACWAMTHATL